ncbi:MAG: hypothetical protein O7C61_09535, partial [SAR324 cluster bacterium]|nr:hypothetical protein [SAR324 cluster bacterium]
MAAGLARKARLAGLMLAAALLTAACGGGSSGPSTTAQPTLVSISVSPADFPLFANATAALKATGSFDDATTQNLTNSVTWSTDAPGIATMDTSGRATAGSTLDTATITA